MSTKTWVKGETAWLASEYDAPKKVTLAAGGSVSPRVAERTYSRQVDATDLHETEEEAVKASARMYAERLCRAQRQRQLDIEMYERRIASYRRDIEAAKSDIEAAIARAREFGVEVQP